MKVFPVKRLRRYLEAIEQHTERMLAVIEQHPGVGIVEKLTFTWDLNKEGSVGGGVEVDVPITSLVTDVDLSGKAKAAWDNEGDGSGTLHIWRHVNNIHEIPLPIIGDND